MDPVSPSKHVESTSTGQQNAGAHEWQGGALNTSGDFCEQAFRETELQCRLCYERRVLKGVGMTKNAADPKVNQEQCSKESQPSACLK